jgi:hypothetical protein
MKLGRELLKGIWDDIEEQLSSDQLNVASDKLGRDKFKLT